MPSSNRRVLAAGIEGVRRVLVAISRSSLLAAILTAVFWMSVAGARVADYAGEPSALVGFGCATPSVCFARANEAVLPPRAVIYQTGGYDGQFFYYLAAELHGDVFGASSYDAVLDAPRFRRARIGFALLTFPWMAAGPQALLYGMLGTLLAGHLLALVVLFKKIGSTRQGRWIAWAFALNPISLLSFVLLCADGLAISLALLAWCCWDLKGVGNRIAALLLLALAVLTKETMLALVGALVAADLVRLCLGPVGTRRQALVGVLLALLATLPLVVWWSFVGFSPALAAKRGGLPLEGLWLYLMDRPDALLSPRSFLVGLLLVSLALAILLSFEVLARLRNSPQAMAADADWSRQRLRGLGVLALSLIPLVGATADEYWGNYANVARLFGPLLLAFAILGQPSVHPLRRGCSRLLMIALALLFAHSALLHWRSFREKPLPHSISSVASGSPRLAAEVAGFLRNDRGAAYPRRYGKTTSGRLHITNSKGPAGGD